MSLRHLPEPLLFLSPTGSFDRNGTINPTIGGSAISVPGRYGAAWQMAEPITNYVRNPRMAEGIYAWTTGTGRVLGRLLNLPKGLPGRIDTGMRVRATEELTGAYTGAVTTCITEAAGPYTGSMYVYVPEGYASGQMAVQVTAGETFQRTMVDMSRRNEWQRVIVPAVETTEDGQNVSIQIAHLSGTWQEQDYVVISCAQLEPKAYATPYADGELGPGHAWTGTPHASESTREGASATTDFRLDPKRGAIAYRMQPIQGVRNSGYILSAGAHASPWFFVRTHGGGYFRSPDLINDNLPAGNQSTYDGQWIWEVIEWDEERISVHHSVRGSSTKLRTHDDLSGEFPSGLRVGDTNQNKNMLFEGLVAFDRPLTDRERQSLMEHPRAWSWYELTAPGLITNVPRPRGAFSIQAELWRADRFGNLQERVPNRYPVQGTITHNDNTKVKKSLALSANEPETFRGYRDFLVPILSLTDATGQETRRRMGHFIALENDSTYSPARVSGTTQAKGIEHLLELSTIEEGMNVEAGSDPGEVARGIALDGGFAADQLQLPDTGFALPNDKYIDPGTKRLDAINDLYNAAGWYAIWSDGRGILRTGPWQDITTAEPTVAYSTHDGTLRVVGDLRGTPDMTRLRNVVTVRNIAPESDPVFYTAKVTNPEHPLHPERFGITVAETVDDPEAETVAEAKKRAEALLSAGASYYRRLTVQTVADLDADAHELVLLDVAGHPELSVLWWRQSWSIELRGARAITRHELNRVEQYR